jgi:hypothetical protein
MPDQREVVRDEEICDPEFALELNQQSIELASKR